MGIPSAFETINYNVAQLVVTSIIFHFLSDNDFIAKTYFSNIVIFFYIFSNSIAQAAQILVGYHIGNGDTDSAVASAAFAESFSADCYVHQHRSTVCAPVSDDGIHHRSGDRTDWRTSVLYRSVCRAGTNLQYRSHQWPRGAGDTVFPSVVAVFSMWLVATLGAFILAVPMGLGLPGIWIAFAADECLRGLLMQLRWKSGKWKTKSLYHKAA